MQVEPIESQLCDDMNMLPTLLYLLYLLEDQIWHKSNKKYYKWNL